MKKVRSSLELLEEGIDALMAACQEEKNKLEFDIKTMDAPKLLALSACLASFSLDHFDDRELAKEMFDELMSVLAKIKWHKTPLRT